MAPCSFITSGFGSIRRTMRRRQAVRVPQRHLPATTTPASRSSTRQHSPMPRVLCSTSHNSVSKGRRIRVECLPRLIQPTFDLGEGWLWLPFPKGANFPERRFCGKNGDATERVRALRLPSCQFFKPRKERRSVDQFNPRRNNLFEKSITTYLRGEIGGCR